MIQPQHIKTKTFEIGDFGQPKITVGGDEPFVLIAGPCQIESLDHALMMPEKIAEACAPTGTKFIYKSSYDKANRSSIGTARGIGMAEGLDILAAVRDKFGCPVLTDVHDTHQCEPVGKQVDVIQIPAFLCRQTDLLLAAGATGRTINVKKGQFLAPWDMKNVANKIASTVAIDSTLNAISATVTCSLICQSIVSGTVGGARKLSTAISIAVSGNTITPRAATGRERFTSRVSAETPNATSESAAKKCRSSAPRCRPSRMPAWISTAPPARLSASRFSGWPPLSRERASPPAAAR